MIKGDFVFTVCTDTINSTVFFYTSARKSIKHIVVIVGTAVTITKLEL